VAENRQQVEVVDVERRGSYQVCSCSSPSPEDQGRLMLRPCGFAPFNQFPYAVGFSHPSTRIRDSRLVTL
jgi:hypothetical protein